MCGNNLQLGDNFYGDSFYEGRFYGKRQATSSALANNTFTTKTFLATPGTSKVSTQTSWWDLISSHLLRLSTW